MFFKQKCASFYSLFFFFDFQPSVSFKSFKSLISSQSANKSGDTIFTSTMQPCFIFISGHLSMKKRHWFQLRMPFYNFWETWLSYLTKTFFQKHISNKKYIFCLYHWKVLKCKQWVSCDLILSCEPIS
jgi:hypothetical protein